ncbi:MAG: intein-containing adenosylcobalamin-dependent ribonucleoside-diphosphate reductase, partial [Nanoarchaeota archaeon]|nr:intein-containing adenosylcobalamin-dependent ribonucleoside-diphosphate reductase [Nanoarchaeota archaeon]
MSDAPREIEQAGGKLVIDKYFSASCDPYSGDVMGYEKRDAVVIDDSGNIVEEVKGVVFPKFWSNLAVNTVTSKYFRREGVPETGREMDIRQLTGRVAKTLARWGERQGYFDSVQGKRLEEEVAAATIFQYGAFNSPVWFNLGLDSYGVNQDGEGFYMEDGKLAPVGNFYEHPQAAACFICSPQDTIEDMMRVGAITSARIFKGGSGIGGDWSKIRSAGEPVSGGGYASGAKRFMDLQDSCGRVIKSGGKTRRAATMQSIGVWHPDAMDIIREKYAEEEKARVLMKAGSPAGWESHTVQNLRGQNVNISVRTDDKFWKAYESGGDYDITAVKSQKVVRIEKAKKLAKFMAFITHGCGDPGIQNHDIINRWNTCKNSGEIWASNPCVTGETRVLLKDGRWARIDSILGTETVILTNTGAIRESKISGSFRTGIKPVYKLTTKSGFEIKLTADHKVFTINRGFVNAFELTKDDYIIIPSHAVAEVGKVEDKEFFQILGIYLGDGGSGKISNTRGIPLTMSNKSEIKILERLSEYVATNYERVTHKNSPASVQITKTSAKYVITNSILMNKIAQMIDLNLQSHQKCISERIFNLSLGEQAMILQGLFTADGTVANYGLKSQYVALDSTSIQLLKDVQILLLGFGIKSKIYQNRRAGKTSALLPDGKGGLREYEVKETHSLRISREGRIKFEKLIGFMPESPKFEKLKILNESVEVYQDFPIDAIASLVYLGEEQVYDLTEPFTHTFVANGITVHNCSEYMFLDNSACNLASLNLMRFRKTDGNFDLESFCKAVDLYITGQDILVSQASYPTQEITENSHKFRPLGLGFANLGAYMMSLGIAYDSDEARDLAAVISSNMTAEAYLQSTRLAEKLGAFEEFEKNKKPMLDVIDMHRKAAKQIAARNSLEGLVSGLKEAAVKKWDAVIEGGNKHGFRNAQVTLLAPTGTIGFMMDCDTTGCEPDMALVKYKTLAGGGTMTIVNQTVPLALEKLGYDEKQRAEVVKYIDENGTVEGCKVLKEEHLPVFDCSMQTGKGTRAIHPMGHVRMLGALQPHLSGAISKTVNCPESTSVEEIENMFYQAWKLGIKAIAIYRDGSK